MAAAATTTTRPFPPDTHTHTLFLLLQTYAQQCRFLESRGKLRDMFIILLMISDRWLFQQIRTRNGRHSYSSRSCCQRGKRSNSSPDCRRSQTACSLTNNESVKSKKSTQTRKKKRWLPLPPTWSITEFLISHSLDLSLSLSVCPSPSPSETNIDGRCPSSSGWICEAENQVNNEA